MHQYLNFINGEFVATDKWFDNRTPTTNAVIGQVAEAGKAEVDKGRGVIRDPAVQDAVLAGITAFALAELPGAALIGSMDSPITGTLISTVICGPYRAGRGRG